jgi:SAM-dependent methyltransferase
MAAGNTNEFDYRTSHTQPGKGIRYDTTYRPGTALAFYWQEFERPFLEAQFAAIRTAHPNGRYLDFACGTGRILSVGAKFFPDSVGIDVSKEMTIVAREKVPSAKILEVDVLTNPIDVGQFDIATLFRFLLRAGALREAVLGWLRTVIADDGTLIVNNHRNAYSLRGLIYRIGHRIRPDGFEHELLSDADVERMLRRNGFEVVERYGFGFVPSLRGRLLLPHGLLLRIERRAARSRAIARFAKNRIYVCRAAAGTRRAATATVAATDG